MFKKICAGFLILSAFAILIRLGFWQIARLEWKNEIINAITAQSTADPQPISTDPAPYTKIRVTGNILPNTQPIFIGPQMHQGISGYHVITPYRTDTGLIIMVNWGWTAEKNKSLLFPTTSPFTGYAVYPQSGSFTAENRPQNDLWYWADTNALGQYYGGIEAQNFVLYAMTQNTVKGGSVIPFYEIPLPRNKHKQYALFWFGMAGLLLILTVIVSSRRTHST